MAVFLVATPLCELYTSTPRGDIYNCTVDLHQPIAPNLRVPVQALNWLPLHVFLPTSQAPPVPDRAARLQRFAARDSEASAAALADQLFGSGQHVLNAEKEKRMAGEENEK